MQFDISNEHPADDAEISYFIRTFQILERDYGLAGFIVCFAWGSLTKLPYTGPNVIAVIYGDEHCRVPNYVDQVAAVIKCHGFVPNFRVRRRPLSLLRAEAVAFLRDLVLWLPTGWRWLLPGTRSRCHLVPLGYGFRPRVPVLPFEQRAYMASFQGSVAKPEGRGWLRALIGTPKYVARASAVRALMRVKIKQPAGAIHLVLTGSFQDSISEAGRTYFDIMANTKICVAPRGTAHETLRIYEGLMMGCVVIADKLPDHPFYRESPIIQISDWERLPEKLVELFGDPEGLRMLHKESLRYWRDVLSENACAVRCAYALNLLSPLC